MGHINVVVNEGIGIVESVSVVIRLTFELYDRLYVGGAIDSSNEIVFNRDPSDPKYITGFAVKTVNPDKKKRIDAIRLGNSTVNYLSSISGVAVRSKRPKIEKEAGNKVQITNTPPQQQNFDLDGSKLPSLFSGKPS